MKIDIITAGSQVIPELVKNTTVIVIDEPHQSSSQH